MSYAAFSFSDLYDYSFDLWSLSGRNLFESLKIGRIEALNLGSLAIDGTEKYLSHPLLDIFAYLLTLTKFKGGFLLKSVIYTVLPIFSFLLFSRKTNNLSAALIFTLLFTQAFYAVRVIDDRMIDLFSAVILIYLSELIISPVLLIALGVVFAQISVLSPLIILIVLVLRNHSVKFLGYALLALFVTPGTGIVLLEKIISSLYDLRIAYELGDRSLQINNPGLPYLVASLLVFAAVVFRYFGRFALVLIVGAAILVVIERRALPAVVFFLLLLSSNFLSQYLIKRESAASARIEEFLSLLNRKLYSLFSKVYIAGVIWIIFSVAVVSTAKNYNRYDPHFNDQSLEFFKAAGPDLVVYSEYEYSDYFAIRLSYNRLANFYLRSDRSKAYQSKEVIRAASFGAIERLDAEELSSMKVFGESQDIDSGIGSGNGNGIGSGYGTKLGFLAADNSILFNRLKNSSQYSFFKPSNSSFTLFLRNYN